MNVKTVFGHTCPGLQEFWAAVGSQCIPTIIGDEYDGQYAGIIEACDGENPVRIRFCPWCGVKLGEANARRQD